MKVSHDVRMDVYKHLLLFLDLSGLSVSQLGFLHFNSSQQFTQVMSLLLRQRESGLRHLQSGQQHTLPSQNMPRHKKLLAALVLAVNAEHIWQF